MFPSTNFGSPILVPDLDGDGLDDLVFIQAGGRDAIRPHARIYHVGSATGRIVKTFTSPDRREIYSMPSLVRSANDNNHLLYLGTGGETRPGHMFCLDFPSMQERWRFASTDKGFIASPILHDFENRGYHDVIDTAFNGSVYRIDGKSGALVWEFPNKGFESYSSPALGSFSPQESLDVVAVVSEGVWPVYKTKASIVCIDGKTGHLIKSWTFGVMTLSSPLVLDLNGDGFDEVIAITTTRFISTDRANSKGYLSIFDGRKGEKEILKVEFGGFSSSTPLVFDLDGNSKLDIVLAYFGHLLRIELDHPENPKLLWNQFRGRKFDGVL